MGCGPKDSTFQDVHEAVFDGSETLNTNIEFSLGIVPLWMAEKVALFIDEPGVQEARTYFDHVDRVDVGVYKMQNSFGKKHGVAAQRVKQVMLAHGFEPIVLVKEKRETVGVYVPKLEKKFPKEVFVVVMAKHEVVLVRAKGKLEKIVQAAVRNHAHELPNFNKVFNEEIVL